MLIYRNLKSLMNPEMFQGWGKRNSYFEGWYFKLINKEENRSFAVIPGIAMDQEGGRHSFIQLLDGRKQSASYHKYNYESFAASSKKFMVSIENNYFSEDSVSVDLPNFKGAIRFSGNVPWPKPWYSPGIMGPYAFVPFMECYHGIVSMDHSIEGQIEHNGDTLNFNGGRGYIEKDWGSSFPEGYIWFQSNHFEVPGISIKASVAKIPWLRSSFVGFILGIWLKNRLISFTTYNGSKLKRVSVDLKKVEIIIENRRYRIEITVSRDSATALASPLKGHMEGKIEESMTSGIEVCLTDRYSGQSIFSGHGRNVAVDVAGKVEEIFI